MGQVFHVKRQVMGLPPPCRARGFDREGRAIEAGGRCATLIAPGPDARSQELCVPRSRGMDTRR